MDPVHTAAVSEGQMAGTHVGELADSVGLHGDVVLLQLLLDLVDALGDVLGLGRDSSMKCNNWCGLAAGCQQGLRGRRRTVSASLDAQRPGGFLLLLLCSTGT